MPFSRIPLVGNVTTRSDDNYRLFGASQKDQYFKNCHFTIYKNPVTGHVTPMVSAREQEAAFTVPTSTSGEGTAIRYWRGYSAGGGILYPVVSAWGNTNSTLYMESTSLGAITGQAKFIDETSISDTPTILVTSTDNTGWYMPQDAFSQTSYTGETHSNTTIDNIASTAGMYAGQAISGSGIPAGTRIETVNSSTAITITAAATASAAGVTLTKTPIAKILDTDFPGNASLTTTGRFAPIDGYAAIMTTGGRVYTPSVNSVTGWVASEYIVAQEYPDPGLGVMRYRNYIVAFSKSSVEFFQNAGNTAGSPLSRIPHLAQKIGCIGQYAICEINNTIAWIGGNSGTLGIWILDGVSPRKISTPQLDVVLENTSSTNFRLNIVYSLGKYYLAYTAAKDATNAYVYDFETGLWSQWVLVYGITQSDAPGFGISGHYYLGNDDAHWIINSLAPNDTQLTAEIMTAPIDFGTLNRKRIKAVRLVGDRATTAMSISVSWSDDDYQSFSTARSVDMNRSMPQLRGCGSTRRRAFKLTGIGNSESQVRLRLEAIEVEYEVGTL